MKRFLLGACACALLSLPALAETPARNVAGTVDFVEGQVTLQRPDKTRISPKVGDKVLEGDALGTAADGEVHVSMQDGGYLALRPDTRISVVRYQANGESSDTGILSLLQGSLRTITGWIGKNNPRSYQLRANSVTIGIRGTDHETLVRLKDDADGEAGVYDRVYAGGTTITSPQGHVDVTPERVGFQPARRAPRLLNTVPRFFKATRNERLLEGRHARIQPQLQKLREEHRMRLKEGVGERKAARAKLREAREEKVEAAHEGKARRRQRLEDRPAKGD